MLAVSHEPQECVSRSRACAKRLAFARFRLLRAALPRKLENRKRSGPRWLASTSRGPTIFARSWIATGTTASLAGFLGANSTSAKTASIGTSKRAATKLRYFGKATNPVNIASSRTANCSAKCVSMANVLRHQGLRKGDRIAIYMPMIPEAAYAMLACARLGHRSQRRFCRVQCRKPSRPHSRCAMPSRDYGR